ncbi:hypothetical protein NQ317_018565 [Molorchus minor]|uniref:Cellulase n=1 Tax=Molorchus minor TaxID=1323400 RepID=A0ABQ9JY59_9CUCU|nr:hypothetical protein NQ317_018565 [Molorchus minor]
MRIFVFALAILIAFEAAVSDDTDDIDIVVIEGGLSGTGTTTRYWDCCKPSCAWIENVKNVDTPVNTCEADGETVIDAEIQSACIGGKAYMCSNQQATVVNDTLAIGFAATSFTGGADTNYCCACFLLTFQGELSGKQLIVQATNTGGDLGSNQFDLAIPGGGVGIFTEGCETQWDTPSNGWGDQYGGVGSDADCSTLPEVLQPGCHFRFQFMQGVSNPAVTFTQIECPAQLLSISGCQLNSTSTTWEVLTAPSPPPVTGTAVNPSCSWEANVPTVWSCLNDGVTKLQDDNIQSGCDLEKDGSAFMCSDQVGIIVNDTFAYGFAAVSFSGGVDLSRCCPCMLLTFQPITLILPYPEVVTDSRPRVVPTNQWGNGTFDSIESADHCLKIDENLQPGCLFRFTWMKGSANPPVTFQEVECLQELIDVIGSSTGRSTTKDIHFQRKVGGQSGTGTTTRYWDCCKPSCASSYYHDPPVASCSSDGVTKILTDDESGCASGDAYMCSNQEPYGVNTSLSYGFAAASFVGGVDTSMCCACMLLTFTDTEIAGKQMVVQVTNTGSDLGVNHFDIAIPGGGNGIFNQGCTNQWGTQAFDSINSESDCDNIPSDLQKGCQFRFEWMQGASNPSVSFEEVTCPGELIAITGCQ